VDKPDIQPEKANQEKSEANQTSTHSESVASSGKLEKLVAFMAFGLGAIAVNSVLPTKFKLSSDDLADLISNFSLMDFCDKEQAGKAIYEDIVEKAKEKQKNKM
jgi:hypothetical protein